ncbi:MAG: LuxR C-terminal-related transcriptional regulator [Pseudomonadota bacterium]
MPFRTVAFAVFVLFVFGTSSAEIVSEFAAGESLSSMGDDLARFTLSAVVLLLFAFEHIAQRRALRDLRGQLQKARGQLAQLDSQSKQLASQYRGVMQKQFDAWQLTASEQDVVLGLLKGLSFREIALLRETREKTVRQQASSVYRKAGVASRNELAAWFFEDMLEAPPAKTPESSTDGPG